MLMDAPDAVANTLGRQEEREGHSPVLRQTDSVQHPKKGRLAEWKVLCDWKWVCVLLATKTLEY
jgi:hypothetical protein